MEYDIDAAVDRMRQMSGWKFAMKIKGARQETRPLAAEDLAKLGAMGIAEANETAEARTARQQANLGFIADLFVDPKPDVASWDGRYGAAVIAAVVGYAEAQLAKNSRSVRDEVRSLALAQTQPSAS